MSLLSLPTEILVDIFFSLDGYTIMRCKEVSVSMIYKFFIKFLQVCTIFRGIIATDVSLQYKLKLYSCSMIDSFSSFPLITTQDRLLALNTRLDSRVSATQSWPEGELDRNHSSIPPECWIYSSKVLTCIREPNIVTSFTFLDRHSPTPFLQTMFRLEKIINPETGDFETDPLQDLLIIPGIIRNQYVSLLLQYFHSN